MKFYADKIQYGKQITIYCCSDPDRDWGNIFKRIESELSQAEILSDISPRGDRQITGSSYVAYRNADRGDGTYISSEEANFNYNYCNAPDPYIQFDNSPPRFHTRLS